MDRSPRVAPGPARPVPVPPAPPPPRPAAGRGRLIGALLTVPALVALVVAYVVPTIWTVYTSLHSGGPFAQRRWVGGANYREVVEGGFAGTVTFALSLAVVPVLLALVFAVPLATAADAAGTTVRRVTRAVLAVPLVVVTPAGFAVAFLLDRRPVTAGAVREAAWLGLFGVAVAAAVTLLLAALRSAGRRRWLGAGVVTAVVVAAGLSVGLQQFTYVFVARARDSRGAPLSTPLTSVYRFGFQLADFGLAAAVQTLLLAMLAALGLGVAVLVVGTGLRVEVDPPDERPVVAPQARRVATAGAVGLLVVVAVIVGYALWPWLSRAFGDGSGDLPGGPSSGRVYVNTWLPPLLSTVIGVAVAAAAAVGIGALRVLGRGSGWLLLLFAPWLFVGAGPLMLYLYAGTGSDLTSWWILVPRTWVVVPALFVLTVLMRGQRAKWDRLRAAGLPASVRDVFVRPALPMVALVAVATWLVQAQDLMRQSLAGAENLTAPVLLVNQASSSVVPTAEIDPGLTLPPALAVLLIVAAVATQLWYLDRVALRAGRD